MESAEIICDSISCSTDVECDNMEGEKESKEILFDPIADAMNAIDLQVTPPCDICSLPRSETDKDKHFEIHVRSYFRSENSSTEDEWYRTAKILSEHVDRFLQCARNPVCRKCSAVKWIITDQMKHSLEHASNYTLPVASASFVHGTLEPLLEESFELLEADFIVNRSQLPSNADRDHSQTKAAA